MKSESLSLGDDDDIGAVVRISEVEAFWKQTLSRV